VTLSIRTAVESDVPVLAERRWDFRFEQDATPPVIDKPAFLEECRAFLREGLASGRWVCWVAEVDGRIVSNLFLQIVPKLPRPARPRDAWGYVSSVYTDPSRRGQGIGAEVLKAALRWAKERDLELLILWPSPASRGFYERAGFKDENEIRELILRPE
jgi:GNAT superfamily N-acetyltransferase